MTAPTYQKLTAPTQGTRVTVDANGKWKIPDDPIVCLLRGDGIALSFLDQGQPFDIASVPQLPPGELRIGGRGVFLLRTLMDEVACQPRSDRPGNALRLFKRVSGHAKSAG